VIQTYTGRSRYRSEIAEPTGELLVAVLCRVGDRSDDDIALLDTASHWCVMTPAIARELGCELDIPSDTHLLTRFGRIGGRLIRFPTKLVAHEGASVEIEGTWFVSADWPCPMVLGWKGCLERVRFGFDPGEEIFYFADL
jgi:hypothetical protein